MEEQILNEWSRHWFQYILDHPRKLWNKIRLSWNPNVSLELMEEYADKPWFGTETIRHVHDYFWDWSCLSANPNLTWDFVLKHKDKPWNWRFLSKHDNITWEIIQAHPNPSHIFTYRQLHSKDIPEWDWFGVSQNPNITWEIVKANPDKPWDFIALSRNPNITWDNVLESPDQDWNWNNLSENPNITLEIVEKNFSVKDIPETNFPQTYFLNTGADGFVRFRRPSGWKWENLSSNPNLTWELIQASYSKRWNFYGVSYKDDASPCWDWDCLSAHPCITWEIVEANPDKKWNWSSLTLNRNITWDIIQAHPEKPWDWSKISLNPNISWEIVKAHPEIRWDEFYLSDNRMTGARKEFFQEKYRPFVRSILEKFEIPIDLENLILKFI